MEKVFEKILSISLKNEKKCSVIFKILANKTRRDILRLLADGHRSIQNIAFELDLPLSTVSEHVSLLIKTGLVSVVKKVSNRGQTKIISIQFESFVLDMTNDFKSATLKKDFTIDIPIGSYTSFCVNKLCGMISNDGYIGERDNKNCFYSIDRFSAQLIWFDYGYLEYKVPLKKEYLTNVNSIMLTLEICSEAPAFDENWKSDIFFEFNNVNIGFFTSFGDYGARRGKLTPKWWSNCTSYGMLKCIEVKKDGSYINGEKVSNVTINDLNLYENDIFIIKLGVKENAKNRGGLNLFGDCFGDYPQNIVLSIFND